MKGISLDNTSLNKIKTGYVNEYGINHHDKLNQYEDYERFFKTKNNLNVHDRIMIKK